MGVSVEMWRCRIGCFSQPVKLKSALQVLVVSRSSVSLSIRIALFLLLAMHGVEQNPGPRSRGGNNRGVDGRGGKTRGQGRGSPIVPNEPDIFSQPSDAPPARRSSRIINEQSSLNSWLRNSQSPSNTNSQNPISPQRPSACHTSNSSIASSMDIESDQLGSVLDHDVTVTTSERHGENLSMNILLDIQKNCQSLNKKFDKLDKSVRDLKKENKKLQEQNEKLTKTVNTLAANVSELEFSTNENSSKLDQLEGQSRRQNLKFYDIEEADNETWEQSEEKVRQYIKTELEIDDSNISIERAHRLPGKYKPRPVIVKLSFYKDKDKIIKRYRELRKSVREAHPRDNVDGAGGAEPTSGIRVRVSEDFPDRVRKARSALIPFLKQSIDSGKNAYLRFDKLVVNGNSYIYDETRERPVPAAFK